MSNTNLEQRLDLLEKRFSLIIELLKARPNGYKYSCPKCGQDVVFNKEYTEIKCTELHYKKCDWSKTVNDCSLSEVLTVAPQK